MIAILIMQGQPPYEIVFYATEQQLFEEAIVLGGLDQPGPHGYPTLTDIHLDVPTALAYITDLFLDTVIVTKPEDIPRMRKALADSIAPIEAAIAQLEAHFHPPSPRRSSRTPHS